MHLAHVARGTAGTVLKDLREQRPALHLVNHRPRKDRPMTTDPQAPTHDHQQTTDQAPRPTHHTSQDHLTNQPTQDQKTKNQEPHTHASRSDGPTNYHKPDDSVDLEVSRTSSC